MFWSKAHVFVPSSKRNVRRNRLNRTRSRSPARVKILIELGRDSTTHASRIVHMRSPHYDPSDCPAELEADHVNMKFEFRTLTRICDMLKACYRTFAT